MNRFPAATMSLVPCHTPITEPLRIHTPAGWFSMGSDVGQAVEAPVHRVWVDSFEMTATQVTVEGYACFWTLPGACRPHTGAITTSLVHNNLWWRFPGTTRLHTARGFPRLPARTIGCQQKPSGSGPHEGVPRQCCSHGAMIRHNLVPSTKIAGRLAPSLSGNHSRIVTAYLRCARTCMSGVVTGSTPATIQSHLSGIHEDRKKASEKRRAEDPGGTTSRSHDVRRGPASRRNSNTLIMAFGLSAVGRVEGTPAGITDAYWYDA